MPAIPANPEASAITAGPCLVLDRQISKDLQVRLAARRLGVQDVGQEGHQAQLLRLHLLRQTSVGSQTFRMQSLNCC